MNSGRVTKLCHSRLTSMGMRPDRVVLTPVITHMSPAQPVNPAMRRPATEIPSMARPASTRAVLTHT